MSEPAVTTSPSAGSVSSSCSYFRTDVATADVSAALAGQGTSGLVISRPREEAGYRYGALESQLTDDGSRWRVEQGTTAYDPFTVAGSRA